MSPLARLFRGRAALALALLTPAVVQAAVSNVIVWTTARTPANLNATRTTAPTSSPDMRLWWKCDSQANLGWDSTGNARHATIEGTVGGMQVNNPWGVYRTVASGFNAPFCYLVANPGIAYNASRTYEMWIRNPSRNYSVFFSLLRDKKGRWREDDLPDLMRMWVESDGKITMADRSGGGALQSFSSGALSWVQDRWYQVSVVYSVVGTSHTVSVYRGDPTSAVTLLFSYSKPNLDTPQWFAVGGFDRAYEGANSADTGRPGCLGLDSTGEDKIFRPETYGAQGDGINNDAPALRRACAALSAYGKGTLQLTAGAVYRLDPEREVNDGLADTAYWQHDKMGWVVGARLGKVTVEGNGAILRLATGLHFGSFHPVTGAEVSMVGASYNETHNYRDYAADIGNLLMFEDNLDVHVKDVVLDGNLSTQDWGGLYADKGVQCRQSGLYFKNNDNVLAENVTTKNHALDGLGVLNEDLTDASPLKKVVLRNIVSHYNGRQGLSYNCGNHLEIYDSDFSHTGQTVIEGKKNYPGAGIDIEPMSRYMGSRVFGGPSRAPIIENCTFFNNREVGFMLMGAAPTIVRDCTIWQTTSGRAVWVNGDTDTDDPNKGDFDDDHFFIRCRIYGQLYSKSARRLRLEECVFVQANEAYYGPLGSNQPVRHRNALETLSVSGPTQLDRCRFEISQNNGRDSVTDDPVITRSAYAYHTAVENSVFHHANYNPLVSSGSVALLHNFLLVKTDFTEAGFSNASHRYIVQGNPSGLTTKVGPGVVVRGPHYITYGSSTANLPITTDTPVPATSPTLWRVLTPNADPATEDQAPNSATYTASPAFNDPVDSTGARLFDRDVPWDDWNNAVGLRDNLSQTVTVNLGQTRNVYSVKLRMKHVETRRPKRVFISVWNGSAWLPMGLLRPDERDNLTNPDTWYSVTVPTALVGSQVQLQFQIDGGYGWYLNEVKVYGN